MMNRMEKVYEGVAAEREQELLGLRIVPDSANGVKLCAGADMEQKNFSRQCSLLDGYVCLALGGVPDPERPAQLEELNIPAEENALGKAAFWYATACRSEDPHTVTMAVYNGAGALSGFGQMEQWAEKYLGSWKARFLACVQAARWEQDDAGNSSGPEPTPEVWKGLELDVLRQGLRNAICLYSEKS